MMIVGLMKLDYHTLFSGDHMNSVAKKFLSKPAFELEYRSDREPMYTYYLIHGGIEMAFRLGQITRLERGELDQMNDELYEENKFAGAAYDI